MQQVRLECLVPVAIWDRVVLRAQVDQAVPLGPWVLQELGDPVVPLDLAESTGQEALAAPSVSAAL